MFKHHGIGKECGQCGLKFVKLGQLQEHIRVLHEGHRYKCNECDYEAKVNKSLQLHVLKIAEGKVGHEGFKHKCDKCSFKTHYKIKLKDHSKVNHNMAQHRRKNIDKDISVNVEDNKMNKNEWTLQNVQNIPDDVRFDDEIDDLLII